MEKISSLNEFYNTRLQIDLYNFSSTSKNGFLVKLSGNTAVDIRNLHSMIQCTVIDGFEKVYSVPVNHKSRRILRNERRRERRKTKGSDWYHLPATKITEEIHKDLEILQMRSALDPKRFYKKNDMKVLPKYFQIGRVVDSPVDFYSSRIPKKERKRTLVDELMIDTEFKTYTKRKFQEIIKSDPKRKRKAQKYARKLKKLKR